LRAPGRCAAISWIEQGDIIFEFDGKEIADSKDLPLDVEDFSQRIETSKDQDNLLLLIQRGQNNLFAAVTSR